MGLHIQWLCVFGLCMKALGKLVKSFTKLRFPLAVAAHKQKF